MISIITITKNGHSECVWAIEDNSGSLLKDVIEDQKPDMVEYKTIFCPDI